MTVTVKVTVPESALPAAGATLAPLSQATLAALDQALPAAWSKGDPVDVIGDATPERYRQAIGPVLADPQVRHNGSLVSYDHPTEGRVTTPGFPYQFSATPPEVYRGAPLTGEQTREILAELGYDDAAVDRLAAGGVVNAPREVS